MARFAVGIFSFFDNELTIEVVEAENWQTAATKHSKTFWDGGDNPVPDDLEDAKRDAFDMDGGFDCVEIP